MGKVSSIKLQMPGSSQARLQDLVLGVTPAMYQLEFENIHNHVNIVTL